MKTVVVNATKLYNKSRPLASSQSYVRAKEIYESSLQIHPILRTLLLSPHLHLPENHYNLFFFLLVEKHVTANEVKVQEFLQNIRNFKPNEVSNKNPTSLLLVVCCRPYPTFSGHRLFLKPATTKKKSWS